MKKVVLAGSHATLKEGKGRFVMERGVLAERFCAFSARS